MEFGVEVIALALRKKRRRPCFQVRSPLGAFTWRAESVAVYSAAVARGEIKFIEQGFAV